MFTIRAEQVNALQARYLQDLTDRALVLACRCWPGKVEAAGTHAIRTLLHTAMADGVGQGIGLESDLLRYANVALALDTLPSSAAAPSWAAALLSADELSATEKVDLLCKHTARLLAARRPIQEQP